MKISKIKKIILSENLFLFIALIELIIAINGKFQHFYIMFMFIFAWLFCKIIKDDLKY
jgi:hypothetical protein